jgi:hypothetical protein
MEQAVRLKYQMVSSLLCAERSQPAATTVVSARNRIMRNSLVSAALASSASLQPKSCELFNSGPSQEFSFQFVVLHVGTWPYVLVIFDE